MEWCARCFEQKIDAKYRHQYGMCLCKICFDVMQQPPKA